MDMNEETELFRQKVRNYSRMNRDNARNSKQDSLRFGLGEIQDKIQQLDSLKVKDVVNVAHRIKRRKCAKCEDMYYLSHAFLQDNENIKAFLNIPGALQILIRELTGMDSERQMWASETLCNISLGESYVCEKVSSMAGSYLITYLDSLEVRLKRTCLWTVANILATGGKGFNLLIQMELFTKLWTLYTEKSEKGQDDIHADAAACLYLITCYPEKNLRPQEKQLIIDQMHTKNYSSSGSEYHLPIIFESDLLSSSCPLTNEQITYLINFSLANLSNNFEISLVHSRIVYSIRVVANLLALFPQTFDILCNQLKIWDTTLSNILNKIFHFRNELLNKEVLWLVKNIVAGKNVHFSVEFFKSLKIYSANLPDVSMN